MPTFTVVELPLTGFEPWLRLKSIAVTKSESSVTARYVRPRQPKWKLTIGTLQLKFGLTHPHPDKYSSVSFRELPKLVLNLNQALSIDDIITLVTRIQDLLTLFTDSDRDLAFPTLLTGRDGVLVRLYYTREAGRSDQLHWHHCWIKFSQLEDFGGMFESWIGKHESIGPGFSLYTASRRHKLSVEHRFATLMWGLESFHRRAYNAPDNIALKNKICRIISQISKPKDKKWAQYQFASAGELPLATRLAEIFKRLPLEFEAGKIKVIGNCPGRPSE